jgi:Rad3-related DNA helicase
LVAGGCDYFDAIHTASGASFVVTNYAFWINIGKQLRAGRTKEDPLGEFDLIICDEAHAAVDEVNRAMTVELYIDAVRSLLGSPTPIEGAEPDDWRKWADRAALILREYSNDMRNDVQRSGLTSQHVDSQRALRNMRDAVEQLRSIEDDWVITRHRTDRGPRVVFEPVWPRERCEELLFRGAEQRVLMSATMQLQGLMPLGLDPSHVEFLEYDSPFPLDRRPVWVVDMQPRLYMKYSSPESHERLLLSRLDNYMTPRLADDRNGLVQAVSYDRARRILDQSRHAASIITNIGRATWMRGAEPQSVVTQKAVARFKKERGMAFVTPSMSVGEDFPHDQCRWIAIPKLPFVNTTSPVMKARKELDQHYPSYMMMQTLVQSLGRGMRSERDWCEGAIFDASMLWAQRDYERFMPLWFRRALRHTTTLPPMLRVAA